MARASAAVRGPGLVEWIGLVVVVQNIVGSLFNSHLFDFTQGWSMYSASVWLAAWSSANRRKRASAKPIRAMNRIELADPRILVVALRRLGDVLLTTPLSAACGAWPDAIIGAGVRDTAGILAGN